MAGKVVGIMAAGAQKCGEVLRPISGPGEMVVRYSEDSRTHTSTMQFLYQPGSTVDGLERHDAKLIAGGVVAGARIVTATGTDKGEKSALVEVRGFH